MRFSLTHHFFLKTFAELGVKDEILSAISEMGYEAPTPVQEAVIPCLLHNPDSTEPQRDVIALAQTGTGKTAAYGLPTLQNIDTTTRDTQLVILSPTRELCLQIADDLKDYSRYMDGLHIVAVYGGTSIDGQIRQLRKGCQVIVATPGRLIDLMNRGVAHLETVRNIVLDEADEMLNMGFIEDVEEILAQVTSTHRMLLFSATMPDQIVELSKKFMRDVKRIQVDREQKPTHLADQIYFEVMESDKFDALTRIVDIEPDFYGLVFCRTRTDVDELSFRLIENGYAAEGLHGEISQAQREKTLNKFRKRLINILVATDVAARGIDIADLTHVINYSLPQDPESYVHRVGRTGRAGKQGTAITFVSPSEYRRLLYFQKSIKFKIRKETLPNAQDVVEVKRELLKDELREVVENEQFKDYLDIANELLQEYTPEVALASLFRMAYKNDLDVTSYQEIRGFKVENRGTTRLFIACGKRDGYTPRSLTEFICDVAHVRSRDLEDVLVLEEFSFVTVSYEKGKQLLSAFSQEFTMDGKPMLSKAKERGAKGLEDGVVKRKNKRKKQ